MPYGGVVRRWDVFRADLNFPVGSEQGGTRPVLVISNDAFNRGFSVVSVIPLTKLSGKTRNVYSFEVVIEPGLASNAERSIIMPYQIRTIARARLVTRLGRLRDPAIRRAVEDRLLEHIGIEVDTA